MKEFNVITYDFNQKKFVPYDVIPYLVRTYEDKSGKDKPKTREEFRKFVDEESMYEFWGRGEYEIILVDWPNEQHHEKWDVYGQIKMNLDTVTDILMESVPQKKEKKK